RNTKQTANVSQASLAEKEQHKGNTARRGRRGIGKRRGSPAIGGLRDKANGKAIRIHNFYADLNHTEHLNNTDTNEHDNDHIMIQLQLQERKGPVKVNAMIDSGATEDVIDQGLCHKYEIKTTKAERPRMIYLADGKQSDMGPVTHVAKVPMKIGSHYEQATFQVANLNNHEAVLGMPWLREHSPTIDWANHKVTFSSERCTAGCLKEPPMVYT